MSRNNDIYFDVFPKIVPANSRNTIEIRPLFAHSRFKEDVEYEVKVRQADSITSSTPSIHKLKPINGSLYITQIFEGEQEHVLSVREAAADGKDEGNFYIYSLEEDLFNRRPYKGDLHIHTFHSDGIESPAFVTAACRKIGLDFMAITDHHLYYPSMEAQKAFESLEIDMKIFRGEEIHPPKNPVHIVNFGGNASVNELFKDETYHKEVKEISDKLTHIPWDDIRYQYASCVWCFDKVREFGGLGIFCHPYWRYAGREYVISSRIVDLVFDGQPYDAYEVIGGYELDEGDSNNLQVIRYYEERAKGRKIPIVGVTDCHHCESKELYGWYYTIVFSPSLELDELISSVKDLYSVAVEALPGVPAKTYGEFRLAKYALFLIREVFPRHDELCHMEGQLMMKYITGDESASDTLATLKGQTAKLLESYWAK